MSLEQSLNQLTVKSRHVCTVPGLLKVLGAKEAKALEGAMERMVPVHLITAALRNEGHRMGEVSLRNHMNKKCLCYSDK